MTVKKIKAVKIFKSADQLSDSTCVNKKNKLFKKPNILQYHIRIVYGDFWKLLPFLRITQDSHISPKIQSNSVITVGAKSSQNVYTCWLYYVKHNKHMYVRILWLTSKDFSLDVNCNTHI